MTGTAGSTTGSYFRFVCVVVGISAALVVVGYVPTTRLAGASAPPAMVAGCLVSAVSSVVGALPIVLGCGRSPQDSLRCTLLAMGLRAGVAVVLALAAGLSGWFAWAPLLIWVAISYIVLLAVDTVFAVRMQAARNQEE